MVSLQQLVYHWFTAAAVVSVAGGGSGPRRSVGSVCDFSVCVICVLWGCWSFSSGITCNGILEGTQIALWQSIVIHVSKRALKEKEAKK